MVLNLFRTDIYAPDAKICRSSDPDNCISPPQGLHYRGIVEGNTEDSLASISISEYEIAGIVQFENHTYVLGRMENSNVEVFYRDDQLQASPAISLGPDSVLTPDVDPPPPASNTSDSSSNEPNTGSTTSKCI